MVHAKLHTAVSNYTLLWYIKITQRGVMLAGRRDRNSSESRRQLSPDRHVNVEVTCIRCWCCCCCKCRNLRREDAQHCNKVAVRVHNFTATWSMTYNACSAGYYKTRRWIIKLIINGQEKASICACCLYYINVSTCKSLHIRSSIVSWSQ